ncbi:PREDICTED: uncharacterized protein LOC105544778 [Mandrillus leucophaeus]|uniref:uncharacterized protein LOC105544778 n=1 Tax=Mandrillus leucophaeus TaxID=9568 RepID=UPI0005F58C65|nr:PREDICTED: uncharacterized protein LOC105544778 [Mandrillus leucophaeus]
MPAVPQGLFDVILYKVHYAVRARAHPWPGGACSPLVSTAQLAPGGGGRSPAPPPGGASAAAAGTGGRGKTRKDGSRAEWEKSGSSRSSRSGERFRGAAPVTRTDAAELPGLPSAPAGRLPSEPDSGVEDAMARRHESVTRRMWTWAPGLLMATVVFWGHQGNGQGQELRFHLEILVAFEICCGIDREEQDFPAKTVGIEWQKEGGSFYKQAHILFHFIL